MTAVPQHERVYSVRVRKAYPTLAIQNGDLQILLQHCLAGHRRDQIHHEVNLPEDAARDHRRGSARDQPRDRVNRVRKAARLQPQIRRQVPGALRDRIAVQRRRPVYDKVFLR